MTEGLATSLFLTFFVLVIVAFYALRFREYDAAWSFSLFFALAALWALAYGMDLISPPLEQKILWMKFRTTVLGFIPPVILIAVAQHIRRDFWVTPGRILILLMPAATNMLIVWIPLFGTYFNPVYYLDPTAAVSVLQLNNSPWLWAMIAYSGALYVLLFALLLYSLQVGKGLYNRQNLLLAIGLVIPSITDLLYSSARITPVPGYNLAPNLLLLTALLGSWALFRYQFLSLSPIARQSAMDSLSALLVVVDTNDRIVDFNKSAGETLGLTPEIAGQPLKNYLPGWASLREQIRQENGLRKDIRLPKGDGSALYEVSHNPVINRRGQEIARVYLFQPYTAQNELQDKLRQLFTAAEHNPVSMVITDTEGSIQYANPKLSELTGYDAHEIIGKHTRILKSGQTPQAVYETMWATIKGGHTWRGEILNRRKNGALYWEEMIISPVQAENGQISHFIALKQDISARKQAEADTQKHLRELNAINAISQAAAANLDLRRLAGLVGETLRVMFSIHGVFIAVYEERENLIQPIYWNINNQEVETAPFPAGSGWLGQIIQTARPILVNRNLVEQAADFELVKNLPPEMGLPKSWMGLPLISGNHAMGVLSVQDDKREDAFNPETIQLLNTIAASISVAIQNARLFEETRRRADEMASLYEIGVALSSNLDLNTVLMRVFEKCQQILPFDSFYIAIYDNETHLLQHPLFYDKGEIRQLAARDIRITPGLSGEVVLNHETLYIPDALDPTINAKYQIVRIGGMPSRTYLGVPMMVRDQAIGVLSMQSYRAGAYSHEQIQLLQTIAGQAAIAIQNSQNYEKAQQELRQRKRDQETLEQTNVNLQVQLSRVEAMQQELRDQAARDPLTGLFNRRTLDEYLRRKLQAAQRRNMPLSIIMMDIDHFKHLNDTYGHPAGDAILKTLGELLQKHTRASDLACRYGGEEFLVALADASIDIAARRAEEIRESFAAKRFTVGQKEIQTTVSIGVAAFPFHGSDIESLIMQADQAMYAAKTSGRNRVVIWQK